jgi:single-strand DNA-binding protein
MNIVVISGVVSREVDVRTLANGSVVWSFDLRTANNGVSVSVPVSWMDPPTRSALAIDDDVVVVGHVQRRFFKSGGQTQSRTEVSVASLTSARSKRRVAHMVGDAVDDLLSYMPAV